MDLKKLEAILSPVYNLRGPAESWEQVERIDRLAHRLCDQLGEGADEVDRDLLSTLCYLVTLGAEVPRSLGLRGNLEAYLVQEGWTSLSVRQLVRALEKLPHQPDSLEEKLAVDAFTLTRSGMLGFARHIQRGTSANQSLFECRSEMQKALRERLYTKPAQVAAHQRRVDLRELIGKLQKALEE